MIYGFRLAIDVVVAARGAEFVRVQLKTKNLLAARAKRTLFLFHEVLASVVDRSVIVVLEQTTRSMTTTAQRLPVSALGESRNDQQRTANSLALILILCGHALLVHARILSSLQRQSSPCLFVGAFSLRNKSDCQRCIRRLKSPDALIDPFARKLSTRSGAKVGVCTGILSRVAPNAARVHVRKLRTKKF